MVLMKEKKNNDYTLKHITILIPFYASTHPPIHLISVQVSRAKTHQIVCLSKIPVLPEKSPELSIGPG